MGKTNNNTKGLIGAGILTALGASLCCITPLLGLVAGISGSASVFSWLEPARPFFISISILVLGIAWYQQLRPQSKDDLSCECEPSIQDEFGATKAISKQNNGLAGFGKSRMFLGLVTLITGIMLTFPYYSGMIFSQNHGSTNLNVDNSKIGKAVLLIEGMTCTGCENSVRQSLISQSGVITAHPSYENHSATIKYDKTQVTLAELALAVEKGTGYKVIDIEKNDETGH